MLSELSRLHRKDAYVMSVGTGGCISGNAEVLKDRLPGIDAAPL
jgi:cysteine synthase